MDSWKPFFRCHNNNLGYSASLDSLTPFSECSEAENKEATEDIPEEKIDEAWSNQQFDRHGVLVNHQYFI